MMGTIIYCPFKKCKWNRMADMLDATVCTKGFVEMSVADYDIKFPYCPEHDEKWGVD